MRHRTRRFQVPASVSLFLLLSVIPLAAQTQRGEISGRVTDSSGAVVPGASIELTNSETNVTLTTQADSAGIYLIPNIQYGIYTLRVSAHGFQTTAVEGIHIYSATSTMQDVALKVGAVATQVDVEAKVTTIQTATEVVGTAVESKLMEDTPNLLSGGMRSPWSYIYMTPGVNPQGQLTIAGGRTLSTEVLLDGGTADTDSSVMGGGGGALPSVEAVGEFKMLLNSMPAEYGRSSGGEVTYATKSGTNDLHGSVYEFLRNTDLDARYWQSPTRSTEQQNEFGVAVGGPVYIPKLYNGKNKTFFWATLTGYKLRTAPASGVLSVPTAAMRNGNFTAEDINPLYDPLNLYTGTDGNVHRAQFTYNGVPNMIDPTRFSHVSQFFLSKLPPPNLSGDYNNFVGSAPSPVNNWDATGKIDEYVGSHDRISGFFQWSHPNSTTGSFLGPDFDYLSFSHLYRLRLDWTHNFGPNLINEIEFGPTYQSASSQFANFGQNYGRAAGLTGTLDPNCPEIWVDYPQGFSMCSPDPANTSGHLITTFNDTLSWIKGTHQWKFGLEYIHWNANSNNRAGAFQDSAAGSYLFYPGGTADTNSTGGNTWASFLLGYPSGQGYTVTGGVNMASPLAVGTRESYVALFAEDTWKITPKLTLNYGLRWDLNLPYTEVHGQITSLDFNIANTAAGNLPGALTYYGTGPGRNGINRPGLIHYKDFGPRIGLAYQIDHATVFRAFGGLIYQGIQDADAAFADRTGFQASGSPPPNSNPYGLYYSWDTPYPQSVLGHVPFTDPTFRNGQSYAYQDRNGIGRAPQLYMYSAALEREVPGNILLTASYLANLMRHGSDQDPVDDLNPAYWGLGTLLNQPLNSPAVQAMGFHSPFPQFNTSLPLYDALLPYPQYLSVQNDASDRTGGDYYAGIFQAQKHFSGGLAFLFSYTVSKNISDTTWAAGAYGASPRDPYDRHLEKVIQRFDTPQTLVLSYSYELPFGRGKKYLTHTNSVANAAVGGWTFTGIHRFESGTPVPIGGSLSQSIPTIGVMADRNPGVPLRSNLSCGAMQFDNPAKDYLLNAGNATQAALTGRPLAYIPEGDFQLGNAPGIDSHARQCGNQSDDISLFKDVALRERLHIRIGVDAFNVFNLHSWQVIESGVNDVSTSNFGEITPYQVEGPRELQAHVRVQF